MFFFLHKSLYMTFYFSLKIWNWVIYVTSMCTNNCHFLHSLQPILRQSCEDFPQMDSPQSHHFDGRCLCCVRKLCAIS